MTPSPSLLEQKLLDAEAALVEATIALGSRDHSTSSAERNKRLAFEALNKVRGALQIAQSEHPDVGRQGYSAKAGKGLGKATSVVEHHESFGVITATKPSGSTRLVGTMAETLPSCVELKVYRARRDIDTHLHTEWYFHEGPALITVRMSTYQWAELITSMQGAMMPCTIDSVMGVDMDPVPEEVKTPLEQISRDSRDEMLKTQTEGEAAFFAAVDQMIARVPSLKLSKKKEDEFRAELKTLKEHVRAPKAAAVWASQRVNEDTTKAVTQARIEIAAALHALVHRTGLQAIEGRLEEAVGLQLGEGKR